MNDLLNVATILKPQGIRGELKVKPLTNTPDDLKKFKLVLVDGNEYSVLNARSAGEYAFLTLRGIADRNAAELLRDKQVMVRRSDAPQLPEDTFYVVDVIGCSLYYDDGEKIGEIVDITPAKTDIYTAIIGGKNVPFVAVSGVIKSIDVQRKQVVVNKEKFMQVALFD